MTRPPSPAEPQSAETVAKKIDEAIAEVNQQVEEMLVSAPAAAPAPAAEAPKPVAAPAKGKDKKQAPKKEVKKPKTSAPAATPDLSDRDMAGFARGPTQSKNSSVQYMSNVPTVVGTPVINPQMNAPQIAKIHAAMSTKATHLEFDRICIPLLSLKHGDSTLYEYLKSIYETLAATADGKRDAAFFDRLWSQFFPECWETLRMAQKMIKERIVAFPSHQLCMLFGTTDWIRFTPYLDFNANLSDFNGSDVSVSDIMDDWYTEVCENAMRSMPPPFQWQNFKCRAPSASLVPVVSPNAFGCEFSSGTFDMAVECWMDTAVRMRYHALSFGNELISAAMHNCDITLKAIEPSDGWRTRRPIHSRYWLEYLIRRPMPPGDGEYSSKFAEYAKEVGESWVDPMSRKDRFCQPTITYTPRDAFASSGAADGSGNAGGKKRK